MRQTTPALIAAVLVLLLAPAAAHGRAADGTIGNIAGSAEGFAGDGGPAGQALLHFPADVAYDTSGRILIADLFNNRIRRVGAGGVIDTTAGTGSPDPGDQATDCAATGPATDAKLAQPRGVTALPDGGYLIADANVNCIRRVAADGTVSRFAGAADGQPGGSGDGGPAAAARLNTPGDTAVAGDGTVYIADTGNGRVRRVAPNGVITTIAGSVPGFAGDGGVASAALLNGPHDVAVASDGALLIADSGNNRVRRIGSNNVITTVAGTTVGFGGDGNPATTAQLNSPTSVAALPNGGFLVADANNSRVRRVTPLGAIFTVAGTTAGLGGDGGLAKNAQLALPSGVTPAPGGGFAVADLGNDRVRVVSDVGAVPGAVLRRSENIEPGNGTVMVQPMGATTTRRLSEEDLIPLGSRVDASGGAVNMTFASNASGGRSPAQLYSGAFTTVQDRTGANPVTEFRLVGALPGCRKRPPKGGVASLGASDAFGPLGSAAKRKSRRRLWANGRGRYRTRGRYVAATVRGTRWQTIDQCDTSTVRVARGSVSVRDLLRKRTVVVRARHFYTAPGPKKLRKKKTR